MGESSLEGTILQVICNWKKQNPNHCKGLTVDLIEHSSQYSTRKMGEKLLITNYRLQTPEN